MKRVTAIALLCVALASCQMSCATVKQNEISGKTDAQIAYWESWLVGAQILLPMFGTTAPVVQVAINSAYTALELYQKASDMYTEGKLNATQLTASLLQVEEAIIRINALGNQAGIGK